MDYDQPARYDGTAKGIVIAGHFNEQDTYVCKRPRGMSDWLITYTLDGEGYFRTSGGEWRCRSGEVSILKPETPHEYGTVKGQHWHFFWLHFSQRNLESSLLPYEELYVETIENESTRIRIYDAFIRILLEFRERNEFWQELCMNSLREILILLAQRKMKKIDSRIEEVLHILSHRLCEQIDIETVAKSVGLSSSRLSHLFKKDTGQSIIDTLNQMRVRQAALLLKHTNRSASEVCSDVGFQNYNHFIKQFRKYYQVAPSAYRKQN